MKHAIAANVICPSVRIALTLVSLAANLNIVQIARRENITSKKYRSNMLEPIILFCAEDQMTLSEIFNECSEYRILPLLIRDDGHPTLLTFPVPQVAKDFARRNLPKTWYVGHGYLSEPRVVSAQRAGWAIEHVPFPRRMSGLRAEVLELLIDDDLEFRRDNA